MQSINELSSDIARGIRGVFTDIDDTLTDDGKLGAAAYDALWRLHEAGLVVIPVTGRPAGWCDLIAREWPVAGVIGENGALAFYEVDGKLQRLFHPACAAPEVRARLDQVRRAVLAEVPGARVASDQSYRLFDLAIDFREEEPDLGFAAAERIKAIFERHGAHAKVSSIHVNGWFGDYDKLAMARLFLQTRFNVELGAERERYLFAGDSPNDEPMFAFFPHACGVANVQRFIPSMRSPPRYITAAPGGAGFAEIARTLLERRG